jgi:endo-1,4-beta-xylanase
LQWETTEPRQNSFDFVKGDVIADLAAANKQVLRCHTLVWHDQLPGWLKNGTFTNATLVSILQNHITNVVSHYKGRCYAWDVVNEAFDDSTSNDFRKSIFYRTIGEAFIPIAFAAAAAADPGAKLYYNDYNIDTWNNKTKRVRDVVNMIRVRTNPQSMSLFC